MTRFKISKIISKLCRKKKVVSTEKKVVSIEKCTSDINSISDDILILILSRLPFRDKITCSQVCKKWMELQHDYIDEVHLFSSSNDSIYSFIQRVKPKTTVHWNGQFTPRTIDFDKLNLEKIAELQLSCLSIFMVPKLDTMSNLTHLTLHEIKNMESVVSLPSSLKYLEISMCKLKSICNLPLGLHTLILSCNKLTECPSDIAGLNHLSYLDLECNDISQIDTLPESIEYLYLNANVDIHVNVFPPNLKELFMEQVNMNRIPMNVYTLRHLHTLSVAHNDISFIHPNIQYLCDLITLTLMDNDIYELPIEICKLNNLKNLSVSINRLTELPIEFMELISLNYVDLESDEFKYVPECIQSMSNIEESPKLHWNNSIKQQTGRVQWV